MREIKLENAGGAALPLLLILSEQPDKAVFERLVGEDELFVFNLSYCEPPENFGEIERYRRQLDLAAGRKCSFQGTVVVDLSKWAGSEDSEFLDAFLAYLYDFGEGIRYIFAVENCDCTRLQKKLCEYFAINKLCLYVCKGEYLYEHIKEYFSSKRISIQSSALKRLCSMLEVYAEQKGAKLRMLETVCDRLISAAAGKNINDKLLNDVAAEGFGQADDNGLVASFGIGIFTER